MFAWGITLAAVWTITDLGISALGLQPASYGVETVHHPGRGYALKEGINDMVFVSKEGLRRSKPLPEVAPGEKPILMLGESTCFSYYVVQGQDWPTRTEDELRRRGVLATTMNGGVPGYNARDVYAAMNWYKARLPIDIVVRYEAWNSFFADYGVFSNSARGFSFESSVRKLFPAWPASLEVANAYKGYLHLTLKFPGIPEGLKWLGPLVQNTSLGNALYKRVLPRFLAAHDDVSSANQGLEPLTNAEKYMLYLGAMIQSAQESGITPVLLLPFSVCRLPGYTWSDLPAHQKSHLFENYKITVANWENLNRVIGVIDEINYGFAAHTKAVVIDPAPWLMREMTPQNAFEEGYRSYMKTLHHTGDKGDRLLAEALAEGLIAKSLVSSLPTWKAGQPVTHPGEKIAVAGQVLKYPQLDFEMNKRKAGSVVLLCAVLGLCGSLLLLGLHGRVVDDSGWAVPLGFAVTAALTLVLSQFFHAEYCFGGACALTLILSLTFVLKKHLLDGVKLRRLLRHVLLLGLAGTLVLLLLDALLAFLLFIPSGERLQQYAGWVQLLASSGIYLADKTVLSQQIEQHRQDTDGFLWILLELHKNPALVRPVAPVLAAGFSWLTGMSPAAALVPTGSLAGLLSLPCLWIMLRERSRPVSWLAAALAVISALLTVHLATPAVMMAALACCLAAYAIHLPGEWTGKAVLFLLAGALLLILPSPSGLILATGFILAFPVVTREAVPTKGLFGLVLLALGAFIMGKAILPWFPGASAATYAWMVNPAESRHFILLPTRFLPWIWLFSLASAVLFWLAVVLRLGRTAWHMLPAFLAMAAAWYFLPSGFDPLAPFALVAMAVALLTHGDDSERERGELGPNVACH